MFQVIYNVTHTTPYSKEKVSHIVIGGYLCKHAEGLREMLKGQRPSSQSEIQIIPHFLVTAQLNYYLNYYSTVLLQENKYPLKFFVF